jgi:tRNA(His) guanylyltransferase
VSKDKDSLGTRMKSYESVPRSRLVRRTPVLARLDGKAFHSLCRSLSKPWDASFIHCMDRAATALCEGIQGARLAYVQSDEISLLLTDYDSIKTEAWFDYEVQKMCSVSASICTGAFLVGYLAAFPEKGERILSGEHNPPAFDARFWNVPGHEVSNYFLWRQQDAVRNSIAMLGQRHFSHKQLYGKNVSQVQEMLFQEKGINWNDTPTHLKRGRCILRRTHEVEGQDHTGNMVKAVRHRWEVDNEIPTFSAPEGREYVEQFVHTSDKESL